MAHPPYGSTQKGRIRFAYTASPLSCVAFFFKEQARSSQQAAERGTLLVVISNLE